MAEEFEGLPAEESSNPFFTSDAKALFEKYQQALYDQSLGQERFDSLLTEYDELSDRSQQQEQIITELRRDIRTLNAKRLQEHTEKLDEEQEARQQQLDHAMREVTKTKKRLEAAERELLDLRRSREATDTVGSEKSQQRASHGAAAAAALTLSGALVTGDGGELDRVRQEADSKYTKLHEQYKQQRDLFDEERAEKERLQDELERLRRLLDTRLSSAGLDDADVSLADELAHELSFDAAPVRPPATSTPLAASAHLTAATALERDTQQQQQELEAARVRELEQRIAQLAAEKDALAQQQAATEAAMAAAAERQQTLLAAQQHEAGLAMQAEIARRVEAEATARANWERAQQLAVQAADAEDLRMRMLVLTEQQARQAAMISDLERQSSEAGRSQAEAAALATQLAAARACLAKMERDAAESQAAAIRAAEQQQHATISSSEVPATVTAAEGATRASTTSGMSLSELQAERARCEAAAAAARAVYRDTMANTRAATSTMRAQGPAAAPSLAPAPAASSAPISKRLTVLRLARQFPQHDVQYISSLAEAFDYNPELIRAELSSTPAPASMASAPATALSPASASSLNASSVQAVLAPRSRGTPAPVPAPAPAPAPAVVSLSPLEQLTKEFPTTSRDTMAMLLEANDNDLDRTRRDLLASGQQQAPRGEPLELQRMREEFPNADPAILSSLLKTFNNDISAVRAEMLLTAATALEAPAATRATVAPAPAAAPAAAPAPAPAPAAVGPTPLARLAQLYPSYDRDTLRALLDMHSGNVDAAVQDLGPPPAPAPAAIPHPSLAQPINKPPLTTHGASPSPKGKHPTPEEQPPPYTLGVPPAYTGPRTSPLAPAKSPSAGPSSASPLSARRAVSLSAAAERPGAVSDLQFAVSLGASERIFQVSLSPQDNVPQLGLASLKSHRCTLKVTAINIAIMSKERHAPIVDWPISALKAVNRVDSGLEITGFFVPMNQFIPIRMLCTEPQAALVELRRAINEAQRRRDETTAIEMQREELSQLRELPDGFLQDLRLHEEFASTLAQYSGLTPEELNRLDDAAVRSRIEKQDKATKGKMLEKYFSFSKKSRPGTAAAPVPSDGSRAGRANSLSQPRTGPTSSPSPARAPSTTASPSIQYQTSPSPSVASGPRAQFSPPVYAADRMSAAHMHASPSPVVTSVSYGSPYGVAPQPAFSSPSRSPRPAPQPSHAAPLPSTDPVYYQNTHPPAQQQQQQPYTSTQHTRQPPPRPPPPVDAAGVVVYDAPPPPRMAW